MNLLVVWLPSILCSHILGRIIIPTDELIFFQRGWKWPNHQPVNQCPLFIKLIHFSIPKGPAWPASIQAESLDEEWARTISRGDSADEFSMRKVDGWHNQIIGRSIWHNHRKMHGNNAWKQCMKKSLTGIFSFFGVFFRDVMGFDHHHRMCSRWKRKREETRLHGPTCGSEQVEPRLGTWEISHKMWLKLYQHRL